MNVDEGVEVVWAAYEANKRPPAAIHKQVSIPDAYRIQKRILERFVAKGEKHVGWKIGGNSPTARRMFGPETPFSGFLLESGEFASGHVLSVDDIPANIVLECELCITLGKRLAGPGVTRADVEAAVTSVAPALEIANVGRIEGLDLAQLIADNVSQWGYIVGAVTAPYPKDLDLGEVEVTARIDGEVAQRGLSRECIDNQLDSLAWLANNLGVYGMAIEPGHKVMTGSCLNPAVAVRGQEWEASFTGFGSVTAKFR